MGTGFEKIVELSVGGVDVTQVATGRVKVSIRGRTRLIAQLIPIVGDGSTQLYEKATGTVSYCIYL